MVITTIINWLLGKEALFKNKKAAFNLKAAFLFLLYESTIRKVYLHLNALSEHF